MFSFYSESPLPADCGQTYQGMAFDGCQYYLTVPCTCTATVLDQDLCPVKTVKTRRTYGAICYDPRRACFWAVSEQCRSTLFRLDLSLQEVDRFEPRTELCGSDPLTGVSFCCESGDLLVSSGNQLLEVEPDTREARLLHRTQDCTLLLTAVCLPPYILLRALRGRRTLYILASRDGEVLAEAEIPEASAATALALDPCTYDLLLLTNRHGCYPHLLRAKFDQEIRDTLCPCNRVPCRKCREERPCDAPCTCTDILESIALVEASIAHILNAEGEKIQKAIRISDSLCELLAVNDSVQRTIQNATQLEEVLLAKLEALQTICCSEKHGSPCPSHSRKL